LFCPNTRGEHGGREPGPFFVCPIDDTERSVGLDVVFMDYLENFNAGENTQDAIIASSRGLPVCQRNERE